MYLLVMVLVLGVDGARLGLSAVYLLPVGAVQLAKQASCNDAVRPNPPVQIGEVISDHILSRRRNPTNRTADECRRVMRLDKKGSDSN